VERALETFSGKLQHSLRTLAANPQWESGSRKPVINRSSPLAIFVPGADQPLVEKPFSSASQPGGGEYDCLFLCASARSHAAEFGRKRAPLRRVSGEGHPLPVSDGPEI
jgi:hypothetical protein